MSTMIKDGSGKGFSAKVNATNRLHVASINDVLADAHSVLGERYNINTGDITLTSANKSACLYFKNNEDEDFHITIEVFNLGNTTGGSGDSVIEIIRNPTTGTIVSGASAVAINSNFNFGSNNTLTCLAYKGAEANTITDGTTFTSTRASSVGRIALSLGTVVIPKGSSIGVNITPPASNTSMKVQVAISGFRKILDIT